MRPFLTLIISIALTGEGLASGGILFYTSPGASYVTAIQYEALSTPTAHLVFVSVKGGKRMQIAASGIVSDIPLPDTGRTYSPSEIDVPIAQCEMIAAQYPKYAASMQQVADMWRLRSNAAAQSTPTPAPAPASAPANPPGGAASAGIASTGSTETAASAPPDSYARQLAAALVSARTADLRDVLKQSPPAGYSQAHSDLVAFLGEESKIQADLKKAGEEHARIVAEADRLKKNADVSERPNLLNPYDRSGYERAQRDRKKADEMIRNSLHSVERVKESCSDVLNISGSTVESLVVSGDYEVALALAKRVARLNAEIQPGSSYSNRAGHRSDANKIAVKLAEAQKVLADVESAMGTDNPKGALGAITNKYGKYPEYRPLKEKADFLNNLLSSNAGVPAATGSRDVGGLILQRMHITKPI